ncbi:hypothetical protein HPB50_005512 [Hyalomma asiaticum]|uniref:Uncharacterized protein n=1 Tax=Hyalomma asiaticum TaxID=266040 RepID=A0ACB7S4T5_HYAAI|nr:hypothetical protein HPB50_005512 [Hyalomma asiaticum]
MVEQQAQVLAIPAAKDGAINSPNRNKHPFRCEATERLHASWPRLTAALSFPATKSTDASTPAGLESRWNILDNFSGNGSTAAVDIFQTSFRFLVQIFIGFAAWDSVTGSAQAQVLAVPAVNDGAINSPNRLNKIRSAVRLPRDFAQAGRVSPQHYQIDRRINIARP